jgi:hypothetical protein
MQPKFKAGNLTTKQPGDLVKVKARRWPGVNKPGGVGSIIGVSAEPDEELGEFVYDVKFMVGAKEKRIPEQYLKLHRLGVDNPLSSQELSGIDDDDDENDERSNSSSGDEDDIVAPSEVESKENTSNKRQLSNNTNSNIKPTSSTTKNVVVPNVKRSRVIQDTSSEDNSEDGDSDFEQPSKVVTTSTKKKPSPAKQPVTATPPLFDKQKPTTATNISTKAQPNSGKLVRPSISVDLQSVESSDDDKRVQLSNPQTNQQQQQPQKRLKSFSPSPSSSSSTTNNNNQNQLPILKNGIVPESEPEVSSDEEDDPTTTTSTTSSSKPEQQPQPNQNQQPPKKPTPTSNLSPPPIPPLDISTLPQIEFPTGIAGIVGKYMMDCNKPLNLTSIAQVHKEKYSKTQVENALNQLVNKGMICTLEEGAKIYWFNQEKFTPESNQDAKKMTDRTSALETRIHALETYRDGLRDEIKNLMMEPGDSELTTIIKNEETIVTQSIIRVRELDDLAVEAAKLGKTASELNALNNNELKNRLGFFRGQWRDRKARVSEFLANFADNKGLKPAAKKELIEKIGIETDEDAKVIFRKGLELG